MRLNCVQQASISTRVILSTFTRGQQVCVSILLARGRHCYAGQAICWALPRISSYPEQFSSFRQCEHSLSLYLTVMSISYRVLEVECELSRVLHYFYLLVICVS